MCSSAFQVVGPPGTGKTDVAVQIISNIYHNFPEQRTLIVTHSNQVRKRECVCTCALMCARACMQWMCMYRTGGAWKHNAGFCLHVNLPMGTQDQERLMSIVFVVELILEYRWS